VSFSGTRLTGGLLDTVTRPSRAGPAVRLTDLKVAPAS